MQVHVIWNKLFPKQRPVVLSIGNTLLKQDMRYILRKTNLNEENDPDELNLNDQQVYYKRLSYHLSKQSNNSTIKNKYLKENWQFEIRKLNYEDAGVYQCSLPLVVPLAKNITLQVIRKLFVTLANLIFK